MSRIPPSRSASPLATRRPLALTVLLLLLLLAPAAQAKKKTTGGTLQSGDEERSYAIYVPEGLTPETTPESGLPLIIALHGSGRDADSIVGPWVRLAKREQILVVGPESLDERMWAAPQDGPDFLLDLIAHLKETYPVDPQRIYLFGHSAGAHFAIQMGLFKSRHFAAVAAHAGAIQSDMDWLYDRAERKVPVYLVSGANDTMVPIIAVRRTHRELKDAGFPVEFKEMPRHDHNYYVRAKGINEEIWEFLRQHRLPGE